MSFLVPGVNPAVEAVRTLNPKNLQRILLARRDLPEKLRDLSLPLERTTRERLDKLLPGVNHQGIVLEIKDFPYYPEEEAFSLKKLLFLDGVESPVNLGTISRTAAFFGFQGILIPKKRSASVTPLAVKASEGGVFHLRFIKIKSPTNLLEKLKEEGFLLVGAVEEGGIHPMDIPKAEKVVLMMGGEERSLRPIRRKLADVLVTIPGSGKLGSLNVSCAACIIMFLVS